MKVFIGLLFISTAAFGQAIPLPTAVASADDILDQFRSQVVTKIIDLGKNYISSVNDTSLIYSSSEAVNCNGVINSAGERLAGIQQSVVKNEIELRERVQYNGCNGEIALIEETVTRGSNLNNVKFSDVIKGIRPLELKENETYRFFKITNSDGEELFSVLIEKKGNQKLESFTLLGQKFLTINVTYSDVESRAVVSFYGYSAIYQRKYSRWNSQNEFGSENNTVIAAKNRPTVFLDNSGNQLSLSNFMKNFDKMTADRPLKLLTMIFEYHTYYFPGTEATKTGNQNQRLIEELRLAQNRVLTNTDMTLVKNFLQELINEAELGHINDGRPKK